MNFRIGPIMVDQMIKLVSTIFVIGIIMMGCIKSNSKVTDDSDFVGIYYNPQSGAILFSIKKDDDKYKLRVSESDTTRKHEDYEWKLFDTSHQFCSNNSEYWLGSQIIGGGDWKNNYISGVYGEYNDYINDFTGRDVLLLHVREGFASEEHIYSTGWVLIVGTQCFSRGIKRLNISKLN
ncbi:MAG: hypothetical protein IPL31_02000 [Saprospiraceae bacterium]|nr:hypothetical protein [Saprospiraceae bacterium]